MTKQQLWRWLAAEGREGAVIWRLGWARLKPRWWVVLVLLQIGAALVLLQNGWDDRVLHALQQPDNKALTAVAGKISYWGDQMWSLPLVAILWLAGKYFDRKRWRQFAWSCLWAFLAATVILTPVRWGLGRARPNSGLPDGFYGPHLASKYQGFPSGHSTTAFATAASVFASTPLGAPCTLYACAVGWSRMQLNRHHPLDVLTGVLLGTFVGLCFSSAFPGRRRWPWRLRRKPLPLDEDEDPAAKPPGGTAAKILLCVCALAVATHASAAVTNIITVALTPQPVNTFSPFTSLGAGIDALPTNTQALVYSSSNRVQMLSAGLGPLSYRLNTELAVQDWHWNPNGTWSDPNSGGRGYFTGSTATNTALIEESVPYNLPHRGFTTDQQGSEAAYSRLTDGDPNTYWKSNPYLAAPFTGEPDAAHPQWVLIALPAPLNLNALRITWTNPYALSYQVQFWIPDGNGGDPVFMPTNGVWQTFPNGNITNNPGGNVTNLLQSASTTTNVQYLRLVMAAPSNTYSSHGTNDVRDRLGYAIAEIYAGTVNATTGKFSDLLKHSTDNTVQTPTFVSSVDPWHTPADAAVTVRQPGLDFSFTNGLTRGLPAMVPVPLLYSTPSNAVAEIAYLKQRGWPISYVELGEEPDGQLCQPEDYAALYLQWAAALHALDPALKLGGPCFTGSTNRIVTWPDAGGETSWLKRFLNYLSARGKLSELSFFSFEHYPFNSCDNAPVVLPLAKGIVRETLAAFRADGLPTNVPIFCTEYNYAADYSANMQTSSGGLWAADFLGSFLSEGGAAAWFYQYEPLPLVQAKTCNTYGSFGLFLADGNFQATNQTAQFQAIRLVTSQWAQTNALPHYVYTAHSDLFDANTNETITACAALRPDGQWALLLVNLDASFAHPVKIQFSNTVTGALTPLFGPAELYAYGSAQYVWHANFTAGWASPVLPPTNSLVTNAPGPVITLPKASVCVVRGAGPVLPGLNATVSLTNELLALNYVKSTARTGLTYAVQTSSNLATWSGGTQFVSESVLATNATSQWVQARDLTARTNAPKNFLRLKVTSP